MYSANKHTSAPITIYEVADHCNDRIRISWEIPGKYIILSIHFILAREQCFMIILVI